MRLSERAQNIQASPIRKLVPLANAAKAAGKSVYHLNIGQPDIETPKVMMAVYKNYQEKILAYGPSQGLEFYRKNLVKYYQRQGIELTPDEIIVTTAGSEACFFALMATCNPGDEVIIPEPFYTNYSGFATWAGAKIVPLTTYVEDGFALPDSDKIESLITDKTKAIMICNPGNPTGTVYSATELQRVVQIAIKHDLFVISDEVYREFVYDGLKHTSILDFSEIADRAIMVDSISKRYSACGARIGCIVTHNEDLLASLLKFAQARLCPPTIEQHAANAAVALGDKYFSKNIREYDKRRKIVFAELQKIDNVVCKQPQGAFYIIAKLPVENAEDFVRWLLTDYSLDNETVMVAPAEGFYATEGMGRDEVRLAYILNETDLIKAMKIFRSGLKEYLRK